MPVTPKVTIIAHAARLSIVAPLYRRSKSWIGVMAGGKLCATSNIAERQLVTGVGRGRSAESLLTRRMRKL
jgi:hypothetical protein